MAAASLKFRRSSTTRPDSSAATSHEIPSSIPAVDWTADDESQFPPILTPEDDPKNWDLGRTNQYLGRCKYWHVVRVFHFPTARTDWLVYVPKADMTSVHVRMHYDDPAEAARVADVVWRRYMKQNGASAVEILRKTNFPREHHQLKKLKKPSSNGEQPDASLSQLFDADVGQQPQRKRARMSLPEEYTSDFDTSSPIAASSRYPTTALVLPGQAVIAYPVEGGYIPPRGHENPYAVALATAAALGFSPSTSATTVTPTAASSVSSSSTLPHCMPLAEAITMPALPSFVLPESAKSAIRSGVCGELDILLHNVAAKRELLAGDTVTLTLLHALQNAVLAALASCRHGAAPPGDAREHLKAALAAMNTNRDDFHRCYKRLPSSFIDDFSSMLEYAYSAVTKLFIASA